MRYSNYNTIIDTTKINDNEMHDRIGEQIIHCTLIRSAFWAFKKYFPLENITFICKLAKYSLYGNEK